MLRVMQHSGVVGFSVGARRQSVSFRGVCVTYGETLLLAVSQPTSYGKMVPRRHPMVKPYPRQGSYNSKIGEGARYRGEARGGCGFTIGCRRGTTLP